MPLPNLRSKPSYKALLKILHDLEVKPKSWDDSGKEDVTLEAPVDEKDVQYFLLGFFKSDFSWFEDIELEPHGLVTAQQQRDEIVDLASQRLSERCGRTARGQHTRAFRLNSAAELTANDEIKFPVADLELKIREPPLTGDNLGLKTWGSAWTMVQLLPELGRYSQLQRLLNRIRLFKTTDRQHIKDLAVQVMELGAGTGLVGMAAAALWGVDVILTDLPAIHENLQFNINENIRAITQANNSQVFADILDWNNPEDALQKWQCKEFELILAVDPLYDDDHPKILARTIKHFSKRGQGRFVLTAVPFRDQATELLCTEFQNLMRDNGFEAKYDGEAICRDDWESANAAEVKVRWFLWASPEGNI